MQNARRAGATQVTIDQLDDDKRGPMIRFHDNGPGLASCQDLFTLGSSGWHQDIIAGEDSAGIGFFALANRGGDIYVRQAGTHESWHMTVNPAAFSGTESVTGDQGPAGFKGMSITFAQEAGDRVEAAVRKAARHAPIFVSLNGEMMESEDFLASANHIEDW